jgi:uncharacterized surface protein with fasciclin (FAS1) repeats
MSNGCRDHRPKVELQLRPSQIKSNQIITMKLFTTSIFAALAIAFVAIQVQANAGKTAVGIAVGNKDFSALVAAVKAAELVETLSGDWTFTVSAPTNEAFAKLPEGTVESLPKPENKDKLISILTYHFVPAKVMAADVKAGEVPTVNCEKAAVSIAEGAAKIVGATVIKTGIEGANGVIQVIDSVNLPEKSLSIERSYRKRLSSRAVAFLFSKSAS